MLERFERLIKSSEAHTVLHINCVELCKSLSTGSVWRDFMQILCHEKCDDSTAHTFFKAALHRSGESNDTVTSGACEGCNNFQRSFPQFQHIQRDREQLKVGLLFGVQRVVVKHMANTQIFSQNELN
ncbi:hypothetical protein AVEN_49205-1 [Araneus ventricosus]|uniref:Uncharacterized protein n=1 Tax=Araneus ventricosus TaxID=182803 RepID=A0A4Y2KSM5_ARAVE|nr:hypothetical protein AVEN_49205-1 [Araneus ventricosus]